jgi:hypothetical protein
VDAIATPVIFRDAEATDIALRRVASDEQLRLLVERELRDEVVDAFVER